MMYVRKNTKHDENTPDYKENPFRSVGVLLCTDFNDDDFECLNKRRKYWLQSHEQLKAAQKKIGRSDVDTARFISTEAKNAKKIYRAICFLIGNIFPDNELGDCLYEFEAPLELEKEIRYAAGYIQ